MKPNKLEPQSLSISLTPWVFRASLSIISFKWSQIHLFDLKASLLLMRGLISCLSPLPIKIGWKMGVAIRTNTRTVETTQLYCKLFPNQPTTSHPKKVVSTRVNTSLENKGLCLSVKRASQTVVREERALLWLDKVCLSCGELRNLSSFPANEQIRRVYPMLGSVLPYECRPKCQTLQYFEGEEDRKCKLKMDSPQQKQKFQITQLWLIEISSCTDTL